MTGPKPGQKTVLVTGCTPGGIGHGICLEYHRQGLHVIATARRPEVLAELAELGMSTVALDVTDAESIRKCRDEVAKINGGKLDILVNNAGRTHTHPALDVSLPDVRATFETNVFSIMAMVQAFIDQLITAKGLIINISSLSSITPYLFGSVYCASKAAVSAYSRTLRLELAPFGVRVMVSMTGTVKSNTASQGHRVLPDDSLYQKVKHIFEWRLVFSQNSDTMDTATFARKLVADSLRSESPGWLRSLIGRPDWFWYGGLARSVWFGHTFGEWIIDVSCWYRLRMPEVMKLIGEDLTQKKQK
ncbi:hypothetical protein NUW58_g7722 [Xylaria curta]|uniref:Uncharacterized protein n=1 Tax=Xylaria curta TaxID=42375 RepID=A0ACC1NFA0_9PEZI|nr:hypothetical protein NUW58_g7722 [Xylaria curta]